MRIKVVCEVCKTEFERIKSEVNRSKKLGRRLFCSKRCCGIATINNIPPERSNSYDISFHAGNRKDEYSQFKYHLRNCNSRNKEVSITLSDLKKKWDEQAGKCSYTGWLLKDLKNTNDRLPLTPDRASIDRIDNSKGYHVDNIHFVSYMAQCAKGVFTENELFTFCKDVCEYDTSSLKEAYIPEIFEYRTCDNKSKEYAPFNWHISNCLSISKVRKRKQGDLDLVFLKELWDFQEGKCPYTGWPLKQMEKNYHKCQLPKTPDRASLDRVDSSKGYLKGNVRFISLMAQYAKNKFTDQEVVDFCKSVCQNNYISNAH